MIHDSRGDKMPAAQQYVMVPLQSVYQQVKLAAIVAEMVEQQLSPDDIVEILDTIAQYWLTYLTPEQIYELEKETPCHNLLN